MTDMEEGSSEQNGSFSRVEKTTIELGDTVLLRIPSGDIKTVKLEKDSTIYLGKYGSFFSNELIGQPYGLTYDILNKHLNVIPPKTLQEVEDTDATNELINDGQAVQPLTVEEIETLKKSGMPAADIIQKQIEQHANFSLKTEYSKEKYKKRKEAKYSKSFSTIVPTLFNVCEYWFNKDQNRLRDIRPDTLSQMLNLASIRPGGRYLAVDDASGIVVAGILDRLGGSGRLITICDVDSPPAYPVTTHMNFSKVHVASILSSLNWATADEEYTPVLPSSEPSGEYKSDAQKSRLNKRKVTSNALLQTREELFAGEFEALVISSQYDPFSILQRLYPYLAGSASIVVHGPQVQILSDLHGKLRDLPGYLGPAVTEAWSRRYQVLPGRTHPMMNASGSGGFLLHTFKVYDDPTASSVMIHRHRGKKQRVDESTDTASVPTPENATPAPAPVSPHLMPAVDSVMSCETPPRGENTNPQAS